MYYYLYRLRNLIPVSSNGFILWRIALGNLKMLDSYLSPRIHKRTERLGYWICSYFMWNIWLASARIASKAGCSGSLDCRPLLWISPTPFIWGWAQIQFPKSCVFYTRWWTKSNPKFLSLFPVDLFTRMLIRPPLVICSVLLVFLFLLHVTSSTIFSTVCCIL